MKKLIWIVLTAFLVLNCSIKEKKIKLVVFISVDQLKPELLERYDSLFTGGYRWLKDHATYFSNMHHEHSYPATGPGHFSLTAGRYPGPAGVIGNSWWDREQGRNIYCAEDTLALALGTGEKGHSYRQIKATTLGDWLKKDYPQSKVFSVATKDRAAIMMGGKNPNLVLWYDWKGSYTTSTYYADSLPLWVQQFNQDIRPLQYRDSVWAHTLEKDIYEQYSRPDSFPGEVDRTNNGLYDPILPFRFDDTLSDEEVLSLLVQTPWGDRITLDLALTCIRSQALGQDNSPDIMFVGLSGNDMIGHDFGPYSQESMDNLIKTDRVLMKFINTIENSIGKGRTLFVLTGDHGAIPLPEYLVLQGKNAGRINKPEWKEKVKKAFAEIEQVYGPQLVTINSNFFYYNRRELKRRSIRKDQLTVIMRKHLSGVEGIRVLLSLEDINEAPADDPFFERFKNMVHPTMSPDLFPVPKEYWTFRWPLGSTHSTPYNYNTHVPFYISRADQHFREYWTAVETVDIAPTIGKALGLNVPQNIDGKFLPLW